MLQRLEGHFIRGYGHRNRDASIRILSETAQEVGQYLADDDATMRRIERVRNLIEGFETPYGMELLATVHWVATESDPKAGSDFIVSAVHAWNKRKAQTFSPAHIRTAHSQLLELGWLFDQALGQN